MKEYELRDIKPFNDIFYKTCMYNPLLTGIYYSDGSVLPFLANDIFTYKFNQNKGFKLYSNNILIKPEFEIINEMGIKIEYITNSSNYIEDIKRAIDNDLPVFIPIDRYYWSDKYLNEYFYNLKHYVHFFLVFGYNDLDNTFKVIDVALNGSGCFKNVISYDELIKCYNGYCDFLDNKMKMFIIYPSPFCTNGNNYTDKSEYILTYKNNYMKKKEEIFNDLKNLNELVDFFYSCRADTSLLMNEDQNTIINSFFNSSLYIYFCDSFYRSINNIYKLKYE